MVEVVKEFVYIRIPDDTNEWRESGNTTKNPDCKYVLLRTAQTSAVEPPFTPDKIHHSQDTQLIHPVLLYGSETWVLTKREENQEEGSPNDMRPENRKWCLQEKVQPRTQ
jgi:hypothetical protein